MSVYGIGAMYGKSIDKKEDFLINNCACIGWKEEEAPALHKMLRKIKVGDFIYIKSFAISKKELRIKAVGIVIKDGISEEEENKFGVGVTIKWLWDCGEKPKIIKVTEGIYRNNVFNNTLYEEYNPCIQLEILKLGIEKPNIDKLIDEIIY